jgi:hypothetical protein
LKDKKFMRLDVFILAPIALAAISLFTSPAAVVGQNRSAAESSRDVRREWSNLAKGRTEFEVSDPTLVPSQLALAVEQSGCRHYEQLIKGAPIRFVVLGDRRFAIVLCSVGLASNSHQLFDLTGSSNLEKPKLVQLPFFEQPDGFGTTPTPGGDHVEKRNRGFGGREWVRHFLREASSHISTGQFFDELRGRSR